MLDDLALVIEAEDIDPRVDQIAGPNLPTGRLLNGMRSDYGVPISGNPRTLLYKYASWKESLPPCA